MPLERVKACVCREIRLDIACGKNTNVVILKMRMNLRRRFDMCYLIAKKFNIVK